MLQILRVDVDRAPGGDAQSRLPAGARQGIHGANRHRGRAAAGVDDAQKALPRASGGGEVRDPVGRLAVERRRARRDAGEVGQVPGGARQQAHHFDFHIRVNAHCEPPLAAPGAEGAGQLTVAPLQVHGAEGARGATGHGGANHVAGVALVVHALDRHRGGTAARVDDAQVAPLAGVAGRIEERHLALPDALARWRHFAHAGEEPVRGSQVRQHFDVQRRGNHEAPVPRAGAGGADALQPERGIPVLQVLRVEMDGASAAHDQNDGAVGDAGVVDGVDENVPPTCAVVDDAHEALPARRWLAGGRRGGRKQRYQVCHPRRPDGIDGKGERGRGETQPAQRNGGHDGGLRPRRHASPHHSTGSRPAVGALLPQTWTCR